MFINRLISSHKFVTLTSMLTTLLCSLGGRLSPAGTDKLLPRMEDNKIYCTVRFFVFL